MDHRSAIDYLDSLASYGIRPGLERIRALLTRLGDPQNDFRSVLIAGTNGKGSVAACLAAILGRAGVPTGLFTSPHLVRFEERIALGDAPIAEAELASLTGELAAVVKAQRTDGIAPPTYFEASTALAFLHFSRRKTPIAVLEVGMGGRFDSTNVVAPIACAITRVAMDHTEWLGETLAAIAYQKAGILRAGVPTIIGHQDATALEVIREEAARIGAPLVESSDCRVRGTGPGGRFADPPVFDLDTPDGDHLENLSLSLRGDHQVDNAVVATLLARQVAALGGVDLNHRHIASGLAGVSWPGRIEIVPGRPTLLLDGGHNPDGCRALAAYVARHRPESRRVILFSAMKDKPAEAMLRPLQPLMSTLILTSLPTDRATSTDDLQRAAAAQGGRVICEPDIGAALRLARQAAGADGLVVVSGSLYLVGEVKKRLASEPGSDPQTQRHAVTP